MRSRARATAVARGARRDRRRRSRCDEVILSGGDPLSLSDARLASITDALAAIPHVRRIRVHTRQPIVLPSRVDAGLLEWIRGIRLPLVFVLHVNHANEIDADVRAACARLRAAGVDACSISRSCCAA